MVVVILHLESSEQLLDLYDRIISRTPIFKTVELLRHENIEVQMF